MASLSPNVIYEAGYSFETMPATFRIQDRHLKRFSGVRSCCSSHRADRVALRQLSAFVSWVQRNRYPNAEVVRSGWKKGTHYCDNKGGGFGTRGRSCNGYIQTMFYVDFKKV